MGFKFGFEDDERDTAAAKDAFDVAEETVAPRVHDISHFLELMTGTRISYEHIDFPGSLVRREFFDVRHQLMSEDAESDELQFLIGSTAEDVRNGVYEGGLKSWECCYDLMHRLQEVDLSGYKTFLELGCGTSLPSLLVFQSLLQHKQTYVNLILTDFNYEVLRLVTVPNLFLTWCLTALSKDELERLQQRPDVEGNVRDGEIDVTPELVARFNNALREQHVAISLISGSWGRQMMTQIDALAQSPMLMVSSETIYSPEHLPVVAQMVSETVQRAGSLALVAAKDIYFGVGGSLTEFLACLEKKPVEYSVEKINAGLQRSLVRVHKKK
ncbi:hypothetical protein KL951_003563 [Ogataea haglerorum]|nr:hypothetical protein KL951_003563 [Ogataea haglerorum]